MERLDFLGQVALLVVWIIIPKIETAMWCDGRIANAVIRRTIGCAFAECAYLCVNFMTSCNHDLLQQTLSRCISLGHLSEHAFNVIIERASYATSVGECCHACLVAGSSVRIITNVSAAFTPAPVSLVPDVIAWITRLNNYDPMSYQIQMKYTRKTKMIKTQMSVANDAVDDGSSSPRRVRGADQREKTAAIRAANCAIVASLMCNSYAGRSSEWCIVRIEHKTSRTYGTLCQYLSPSLVDALQCYLSLSRPE